MQKSQIELLALIGAVIATPFALTLPAPYAWVTSISGLVLLVALFSYDQEGQRSAFQSVAFSGACGLGVMLLSVVYYHWLADKGEVHMADGRIETLWLPLTWLCSTIAICAIDRIRMLAYKDARKRSEDQVQRGFVPKYATSETQSKPAAEFVAPSAQTARGAQSVLAASAPVAPAAPAAPVQQSIPVPPQTQVVTAPPPAPVPIPLPHGKETEIYVALVGEGLNLMRTVKAEHVGRDFYKIVEEMPEGETWEFTPGQVVRCKKRNLSTGKGWVAVEEAPRAS
jgi:hypothetical protein